MADDEGLGDLLQGMDDLDAALFGKAPSKKSTPPKNMLSSILANQSESSTVTGSRKPIVSFAETPKETTSRPHSKKTIDDLFGSSSSSATTAATVKEPRREVTTNLNSLFGGRKSETLAPAVVNPTTPAQKSEEISSLDANRIQRLENEIERLNRELDELKKRKRDDEEDLEKIWKDRLDKIENANLKQLELIKSNHQKQTEKLEDEHKVELERIKTNYERQLDSLTSSLGQSKDIINVVERVDTISNTIERLAGDFTHTNKKVQTEQEIVLRIREEKIELREKKLEEEIGKFEEEKRKVHELNIRLNELCKNQESINENEKWKVRDEIRKLNAEREVFKADQNFILENLAKEKAYLEKRVSEFHKEQHDILVRVSVERQMIEQEKCEFYTKRNLDIKRLNQEANDLDIKVQQVLQAEQALEENKTIYEAKMRQLQDLEITLMEECSEIDRMRNHLRSSFVTKDRTARDVAPIGLKHNINRNVNNNDVEYSPSDLHGRNESVRATLKKHSEYLDKYVGQKVAAIAPQNG